MSAYYNGSSAPDFTSAATFFPPFSVTDMLGAGYSGTPTSQPGTATVGVVSVAPTSGTGANGLVGFSPSTGKALWSLKMPGTQANPAYSLGYQVYSNGTDTLGLAGDAQNGSVPVETVDAQSGKVLSTANLPAASSGNSPTILGMVGQTIAVTDGTTVKGLSDKNLSTTVWQYQAVGAEQNMYYTGATLGQCVATAQGYVQISDGTRAGFGTDIGTSTGYIQSPDGSVFQHTNCSQAIAGCIQGIDPATGKTTWTTPAAINRAGDVGQPVVSQQTVVLPCDSDYPDQVCGYRLSDGQLAWHGNVNIAEQSPSTVVGQFILVVGGEGNMAALQVKDGQNPHPFPSTSYPDGILAGQNVLYGANDQTLTAYDASTDLHTVWTVPMPTAGLPADPGSGASGKIGQSGGHLFVAGSNGQVWVVQPPQD